MQAAGYQDVTYVETTEAPTMCMIPTVNIIYVMINTEHRRQAIIWTNDGMFYWRICASPGLNELKISIA